MPEQEQSASQQALLTSARGLLGTKQFATSDTDWGVNACAAYVLGSLQGAGLAHGTGGDLTARGVGKQLVNAGWQRVGLADAMPGDVIVWGKSLEAKKIGGHIGILSRKSEKGWLAYQNSTSKRKPKEYAISYITNRGSRPIAAILRAPKDGQPATSFSSSPITVSDDATSAGPSAPQSRSVHRGPHAPANSGAKGPLPGATNYPSATGPRPEFHMPGMRAGEGGSPEQVVERDEDGKAAWTNFYRSLATALSTADARMRSLPTFRGAPSPMAFSRVS